MADDRQNGGGNTERQVFVGGYPFRAADGVELPDNMGMMEQIAAGLDRVNAMLPEDSRFREVLIHDKTIEFAATAAENRLSVGVKNFELDYTQEELEGILLHEAEHMKKGREWTSSWRHELRKFLNNVESDFILQCKKDSVALSHKLMEEYDGRYGELLLNLDQYRIRQDGFIREMQEFCDILGKKSPTSDIFSFSFTDDAQMMWGRISALVHNMEGENTIEREAERILSYVPAPELPVWPPFRSVYPAPEETRSPHEVREAVQEELQAIAEKTDMLVQSSYPLVLFGMALNYAEEIRCDRHSVRHNEKCGPDEGRQEAPYELMRFLNRWDNSLGKGMSQEPGMSHPPPDMRAMDMLNATAGRYMEEALMTGASPEDAAAIGSEKAQREMKTMEAETFPPKFSKVATPLNSPERTRALEDYRTHAEKASARNAESSGRQR